MTGLFLGSVEQVEDILVDWLHLVQSGADGCFLVFPVLELVPEGRWSLLLLVLLLCLAVRLVVERLITLVYSRKLAFLGLLALAFAGFLARFVFNLFLAFSWLLARFVLNRLSQTLLGCKLNG